MKIGICGDLARGQNAIAAGYDYAEFNLSKIARMTEDEFRALTRERERLGVPVESFNGCCPSDIRLTVGIDEQQLAAYAEVAFSRAAALGGALVVVGSGRSRDIPEGYDISVAVDEFSRALTAMDKIAGGYGIRLAIEPLCLKDTNFVNTLTQAVEVCDKVASDNVGCLVDWFHFGQNGEPVSDVIKYGRYIVHTHLARSSDDRRIPTVEDMDQVRPFFDALRSIGYEGRMSLEGKYHPDFDGSIAAAMQLFRGLGVK